MVMTLKMIENETLDQKNQDQTEKEEIHTIKAKEETKNDAKEVKVDAKEIKVEEKDVKVDAKEINVEEEYIKVEKDKKINTSLVEIESEKSPAISEGDYNKTDKKNSDYIPDQQIFCNQAP